MASAQTGGIKIERIIGDYSPDYFYGIVKIQKVENSLRSLISQIFTPSYQPAKKACSIFDPYVLTQLSIRSATEFMDIIRMKRPRNCIASLDVESLFINVSVKRAIQIVLDFAYGHSKLPPFKHLEISFRKCSKHARLKHHSSVLRVNPINKWIK